MSACIFMMRKEWFDSKTDEELLAAIVKWQDIIDDWAQPDWGKNRFYGDYASGCSHNIEMAYITLWKRGKSFTNPCKVTLRNTKPTPQDYDGF